MHYLTIRNFARELRKNQTPAEQAFWEKVRKRRFMGLKFKRQFIIQHEDILGIKSFFISDFYCFELMLLVEIDGKIHQDQLDYDQIREGVLKEMGYNLIRFTNQAVLNDWGIVAKELRKFILSMERSS